MKNIEIKINKRTRKVECKNSFLGNELENLQENLIFTFDDEFVDGIGRLEYEINHQKNYFILEKVGESYTIPVKNVLTVGGRVYSQLVITEEETEEGIPVFKSNVFYLYVKQSINAVNEAPEGYELWIDTANQKLLEFASSIVEVDNLNLNAERVSDGVELTITRKDGSTETILVNDGERGEQGEKGEPGAIKMIVVNELPSTGQDDTIYLVPIENPDIQGNNYAEYVYINNQWELLGKIGVQVDLSNYFTKQEINNKLEDYVKNTDKATTISSSSTDDEVATPKAVYNYINSLDGNNISY